MKLPKLAEVRKAVGALTTMEAAAVSLGLLDNATAGLITAGLGVLTAGVVFVMKNERSPASAKPKAAARG